MRGRRKVGLEDKWKRRKSAVEVREMMMPSAPREASGVGADRRWVGQCWIKSKYPFSLKDNVRGNISIKDILQLRI